MGQRNSMTCVSLYILNSSVTPLIAFSQLEQPLKKMYLINTLLFGIVHYYHSQFIHNKIIYNIRVAINHYHLIQAGCVKKVPCKCPGRLELNIRYRSLIDLWEPDRSMSSEESWHGKMKSPAGWSNLPFCEGKFLVNLWWDISSLVDVSSDSWTIHTRPLVYSRYGFNPRVEDI